METKTKSASKEAMPGMTVTGFRYIVNDVEAAVKFYSELLGFEVEMHVAPGFAKLSKGGMNLFINKPGFGGAGQSMADGAAPEPGGWNRFHMEVEDIEAIVENLRSKGAQFRSEIMTGQGGKQVLLKDPSGNLVELFENKKQ